MRESVTMLDDGKFIAVGGPILYFFDRTTEPNEHPDDVIGQDLVSLVLFGFLGIVIIQTRSLRKKGYRTGL